MIFEAKIPDPPLDQFIETLIYHQDVNPSHAIDRFLPDGNTEIIIDLSGTPKHIYDNETLDEIQVCKNAWASGVRTEPISIPSGKDSAMIVILFKKGMAYPFFPVPMNEMSDCVIDTDLLWGKAFENLRETLLGEPDIFGRFAITEKFLIDRYRAKLDVNECVKYAISQITASPDQVSLGRLYDKIGYSQKHFTEMFKLRVGVTPKSYAKILRFQKAISEVETIGEINWSFIAADCGFYDQAHFINDFKCFSGFTPEDYLKRKNGVLNYVPVS
ncbi:MAG: helix-turn-helix domain-containing protein [Pyrinomonadaceae bacterium]